MIGVTDYLIASAPRHIGWLGLLLVETTMFANAEAAMPPQLAVSNVSVIDPITAEASLNQLLQSFTPEPVLMKGSAMCPVSIHWIVLIWKAAWL